MAGHIPSVRALRCAAPSAPGGSKRNVWSRPRPSGPGWRRVSADQRDRDRHRPRSAAFLAVASALCLLVRAGRRAVDRARHGHVRRTLIVGTGRLARHVYRDIRADRPDGYELVGFVDEPTTNGDASSTGFSSRRSARSMSSSRS